MKNYPLLSCSFILINFLLLSFATPVFSQDTDGDGVADVIDLDDDNDGISDLDENPPCQFPGSFDPGLAYLFQSPIANKTKVTGIDLTDGSTTFVGTVDVEFNAVTFNEETKVFWGSDKTNNAFVIVDPVTWVVTHRFGSHNGSVNSGAYDPVTKRYVARQTDGRMHVLDADPNSAEYLNLISSYITDPTFGAILDIVVNTDNGLFYGIDANTADLIEIDVDAETETKLGLVDGLKVGSYGAAYSSWDGKLYFGNNVTGEIFLIDLEDNPLSATHFVTGPKSSTNDGARPLAIDIGGNCIAFSDFDGDGIGDNADNCLGF